MSAKQIKVLFVVLAIAALGVFFYRSMEFEEVEVNLGYGLEAKKNSFLAAQILFDNHNIVNERTIKYTLLDNMMDDIDYEAHSSKVRNNDTLVLVDTRGTINGARFDSLWDWVNGGGNLIVSLENPFLGELARDDVLDALGLTLKSKDDDKQPFIKGVLQRSTKNVDEGEDDSDTGSDQGSEGMGSPADPKNTDLNAKDKSFVYSDSHACRDVHQTKALPLTSEELAIDLRSSLTFYADEYQPRWSIPVDEENNEELLAANFAVGSGQISVLSSMDIWRNYFIQCHDHAYFLLSLAGRADKLWILEGRDRPSLFSLMYRHVPEGLVALLLSIILLIWRALTRFGPLFLPASIGRRRFSEHILASATFLWRRGEYTKLLHDLRFSVESMAARRVAMNSNNKRNDKIEVIVQLSHLNKETVKDALYNNEIGTLDEFIELVKTLKILKDSL